MKNMKKILVLSLAALLLVAVSVGGTVAYLTAQTTTVTNTFTESKVNITLTETTGETYKMVPGADIAKDPRVNVLANSEACWVFVKIEKENNFDTFLSFDVADGWSELDGVSGVYYREVAASAANQDFNVLKDNKVVVSEDVTNEQMNALTATTRPQLKFTAYAVQKAGFANAAAAWAELNPTTGE